jgi:3-oxoadipate enol-lactonase
MDSQLASTAEGKLGGKSIIMIHALGCDRSIWDGLIPHLADDYRVIRYDLPGHGASRYTHAGRPYTIGDDGIDSTSRDLQGIYTSLNIEEAVLVGISVGGMIALAFAAAYPERVSGLVVCDTDVRIGTAGTWNDRIDGIRQQGMDAMADKILSRWFTPSFAVRCPEKYQSARNMLLRCSVEGYMVTCEAIRDADLSGLPAKIMTKTLVLCGAEDVSTPPDSCRKLAGKIPNARFAVIEKTAHLPCIEQPDQMAAMIVPFLQELLYG